MCGAPRTTATNGKVYGGQQTFTMMTVRNLYEYTGCNAGSSKGSYLSSCPSDVYGSFW